MAAEPLLMLVSPGTARGRPRLPEVAREAARAGVDVIQVREKDLPDRELRALTAAVTAAVAGTASRVLVNGRPDVAAASGAHGVQLPEQGLPVADVKRAFPGLLVGASRHSVEGALQAESEGADFVVLGPIFATPGKEDRALGLGPLAESARRLAVPVYAIGGIDAAKAALALRAGARGLAAIRSFQAGSIARVAALLKGAAG